MIRLTALVSISSSSRMRHLGLLIIGVIDPAHVQLVWRAWAETNLTGMQGPNRLSGLIKVVVAHTLANFSSKS